ncbi:hypothetical protein V8C86DRAFT_1102734 [Haematococcus lacustris]
MVRDGEVHAHRDTVCLHQPFKHHLRGTWLACLQALGHPSLAASDSGSIVCPGCLHTPCSNKNPKALSTHAHMSAAHVHACIMYAGPEAWSMFQEEASELPSSIMCALVREMYCADYIVRLLEAVSAPSHPGAVTTLGPSPPSPSVISSSLLAVILSVLPRSLVVFQACAVALRLAVKISSFTCPGSFPVFIRDSYLPLCHALRMMVQLWPDQRCRPAMLRVMARSAAAGAHAYMTLALLLDGAPDHGSEPRSLYGSACTAELEQTLSTMVARVCQMWLLVLAPPGCSEQLSGTSYIRSKERCRIVEGNASSGKEKVLPSPPSVQQLAPLALDLVWGMEGMLQMTQHHYRMSQTMLARDIATNPFHFFSTCATSLILCGRVIEVLATPSVVGPAGLAAQPASWLPCGNSLVEGWCSQLLDRVCHLLCITTPGLKRSRDDLRLKGCRVLADRHNFLLQGRQQAPSSMSPEAERLLACLTLVLTVALPLDTWLAAVAYSPAAGAKIIEQAIHDSLTNTEAEQVWGWQALAEGTPAEASLASVLRSAADKLQLPHLVAPAPQGWQSGRLTLERGRGPAELMWLCLPRL